MGRGRKERNRWQKKEKNGMKRGVKNGVAKRKIEVEVNVEVKVRVHTACCRVLNRASALGSRRDWSISGSMR